MFDRGETLEVRGWPWYKQPIRFKYRQGPVPRTGNIRRLGNFLRHPKTTNERRTNKAHKIEGVRIRGRRVHLPTVWDDLWRKTEYCWKAQSKKKAQWDRGRVARNNG